VGCVQGLQQEQKSMKISCSVCSFKLT
jgi:DNA-directed RNA polymerase subunit RPC12/RpoP